MRTYKNQQANVQELPNQGANSAATALWATMRALCRAESVFMVVHAPLSPKIMQTAPVGTLQAVGTFHNRAHGANQATQIYIKHYEGVYIMPLESEREWRISE